MISVASETAFLRRKVAKLGKCQITKPGWGAPYCEGCRSGRCYLYKGPLKVIRDCRSPVSAVFLETKPTAVGKMLTRLKQLTQRHTLYAQGQAVRHFYSVVTFELDAHAKYPRPPGMTFTKL